MLESGVASKIQKVGNQIAGEEILARLNDPSLLLVNVMPKEAFDEGHIPRSLNLPLAEIESKARQVFPEIGRELVIYCGGPT
ncbi:MAG TPA: rhodanese-like domain-containing protein [Candidatus Binatia bacterium]|jgi:rhodanese-related sulfurtransferase